MPNCSPLIKKQKVEVVSVCSCIIVSFGCHKGQHMVIEFTRLRRSFITFASHENCSCQATCLLSDCCALIHEKDIGTLDFTVCASAPSLQAPVLNPKIITNCSHAQVLSDHVHDLRRQDVARLCCIGDTCVSCHGLLDKL